MNSNLQWSLETLAKVNDHFSVCGPEDVLGWALAAFAPEIALATGFGPSGVVLMHLVARLRPETTICYLDTGLLFPETYDLRGQLARRLGIRFTRLHSELSLEAQAAGHGPALWERNPDLCCHLRKVEPLRRFLATQRAWISGIRRDQGPTRARTEMVTWDVANGLVKVNPLAYWTRDQVWAYIRHHDLPTNVLHDEGYSSIGCIPCTRPVAPGEDERAGRWSGQAKTECGIHVQPDGRLVRTVG
ncbi:MAG: phosphoadenylyl-sulfate reductase [Chloroflexi bacterium]|nr:phosphoadenylyl-sulfate reductase [Chloroflexota bacterium]MCI0579508.1 phosphoadenylyl-sulfate reductase [Chloroflexota bacterium]MCI0647280.1 phosphoadenylyl-sulfate reductase [Chloroflexota bacterium]MCI0729319.1 phosphoadenylyl-sulfate reductase [Chloroflexota bacterium]